MSSITTLETALMYLDAGFSVIPLQIRSKQPIYSLLPRKPNGKGTWKPFTETPPDEDQVRAWFTDPNLNIALVMGEVSGNVIALDFDDHGAYDAWMERYPSIAKGTATQITKNGAHVLLRVPAPCPPNWAIKLDGVHIGEIRGEGGYIAAWPSIHPSGHQYEWVKAPWDNILAIDSLQDVGIARVVETPKTVATVPQNGKHPLPPRTQNFMINGAVVGRGVNDELFNAAIQHAAAGYSLDETEAALLPVAQRFYIGTGPGNTEDQSLRTIKSGWSRGQGKEPITLKNPRDLGNTGGGRQANLLPKSRSRTLNQPDLGNTPSPGRGRSGAIEENGLPKSGENGDLGNNGLDAGTNSLPKSDDDNQRPFYTLQDSSMVYTYYKKNGDGFMPVRQVIPFSGQVIRKTILFEENGERLTTFTVTGKKDGRPYEVDVDAVDFTDGRRLYKRLINYLPGRPPALEDNLVKRISPAISSLSPQTIPEIKAISSTGWTPDGQSYVMPQGEPVGKAGYICKLDDVLTREFRFFTLKQNSDEENKAALAALLDLKQIYNPSAFYVILAHSFLPPLIRWLGNQARYLLHLHAQTGSLKTELAKLMISLYGPLEDYALTYKWTGTPVGAEARANALKDALMLIDDLKPNTIRADVLPQWVGFIQAYVDAEGRKRGTIGGGAGASRPPRCILISTGEAIPEAGEASFTARMLLVQLDKQPDGWNSTLQAVKEKSVLFSGLMRSYIAWLLKADGYEALKVMRKYQTNNVEAKAGQHLRLANNYAANCTAAELFATFCQQTGLMSNIEQDVFLAAHQQAIIEVVTATGRKVQEERYSRRFLDALRDAVSTGFAYIGDHKAQARRVGWEDQEAVYLLSGSMSVVNQWLSTSNSPPINIPLKELKQQLYEDGFTRSTPGRVDRMEFDLQRVDPADKSRQLVIGVHRNKFYNLDDDAPEISND